MESEKVIKKIYKEIQKFNLKDIPNLDLYMDQVTTYINKKFEATKRQEDDKLLTKTMINNYSKSNLLPAPEKKKYSKDHILALSLIFFFKNVISISDVNTVITPILEKHFHNDDAPLEDLVNNFLSFIQQNNSPESILNEFKNIDSIFEKCTDENSKTLSMIAILSYDIFIRKIIIEKLIDSIPYVEENEKGN